MSVTIFTGDCREVLRTLPDGCVHTAVTSPPYFGLRDYGTGIWVGGDEGCDHVVGAMRRGLGLADSPANTRGGAKKVAQIADIQARALCPKCGARREDLQIGMEPTPEAYVAALVEVFAEVRRVLRDDGTLWLNLGDSYCARPRGSEAGLDKSGLHNAANVQKAQRAAMLTGRDFGDLKQKDLIGIPWRVAFALQADGWYLRQDIIWAKPNPMPESVRDRCTKSHEYVFLFSKSPHYYFNAEAIAEPSLYAPGCGWVEEAKGTRGGKRGAKQVRAIDPEQSFRSIRETRNKRSVWTVATIPYKGAHFATYPPDLIEPCILAGSPPGGTVLDPFGGAGTTGLVADRLGRYAVLIELNPDYVGIADERLRAGLVAVNGAPAAPVADDLPLFAPSAAEVAA